MRKAPTFITVVLAIGMAGCALDGKAKKPLPAAPVAAKPTPPPAPAPPPPALSIPQTQVELPRPQPLDRAALSPESPPPAVEVAEPVPASRPPAGRGRPPAAAPPPTAPVITTPEPATTSAPPIQEIVPPLEAKRLQDQAQARRREVQQILDQLQRRNLSQAQRSVATNISSLLTSSFEAEKRNDMKLADALASQALISARDLINGK